MEGANLSGDLKNPTYSIPVGTLAAVTTSIFFYLLLIISFAGSFNSCTLREDTTIMQEAAWGTFGTYLVVAGIIISASSSALGSLFGGSRVLQAIARDKLFPYTKIFEYGSPKGDEPRTAVLITWLIAQGLVFVGGIDVIAPISTSFFCLSYATVNLSCFLLAISGTPNFRPAFKYYSWHICLIGTISNLAVMFYVDWHFGLAALGIEIAIFAYLIYKAPDNVWGDVTQSIIFHQVRKYLLKLDERQKHVKGWRPSILLLADSRYSALIDFCNNLKKGGLYIIGVSIEGEFGDFELTSKLKASWIDFIASNSLKAFPQINVAPNIRNGLENIILLGGLGALQANTVILPMIRIQKTKHDKKMAFKLDMNEKLNSPKLILEETKEEENENKNENDKELEEKDTEENVNDIAGDDNNENGYENNSNSDDEEEEEEKEEEFEDGDAMTTTTFTNNSHIISEYNMDGSLDQSKTIESLVPQTPADMNPNEYTKLCRNILKYNKNVILTANFHSFDSSLIVSSEIQEAFNRNSTFENEIAMTPVHKPKVMSAMSGDGFLDKTINHDFMKNASVPKFREEQAQWIDVWLFANDYTFDLMNIDNNNKDDKFPMLIMQLSHILLQNKVYAKKAKAKIRVLLMVDNKWGQSDQNNFDLLLRELRLKDSIDHLQILKEPVNYVKPKWEQIIKGKKKSSHLKKYYNSLNSTIKSLSSETYFTFMKLPEFPPIIDNNDEMTAKLNLTYYQSLYVLLRGLPPTALIATGEIDPVISTDL